MKSKFDLNALRILADQHLIDDLKISKVDNQIKLLVRLKGHDNYRPMELKGKSEPKVYATYDAAVNQAEGLGFKQVMISNE